MSEFDQLQDDAMDEDIEMASIAEEEDLDEKFSHQGTSTVGGKKKIVSLITTRIISMLIFNSFADFAKL